MKRVLISIVLLGSTHAGLAQLQGFENQLKLDTIHTGQMKQWKFGATSISCLSDGLWEHILPKSTQGTNKIILNKNELNYFLELDDIKIKTATDPISKPEHWENRFGKQIQTITLSKPLTVLAIENGELVQFSVDSLVGLQYHTFYPHGELDVPNQSGVPIVYEMNNQFDVHSPILLVTSNFMRRVDLQTTEIYKDTILFDTENFLGKRYITGIDFNADGQDEVIMYHETTQDSWASEGDESESYTQSIIVLYYKNKWYRTSYWQEGQDGIEGF